jgi:hypothetical protein
MSNTQESPPDAEQRGSLADADEDTEFWYPPDGTTLFHANDRGQPCDPKSAVCWTYAGAASWYRTEVYPSPRSFVDE